MTTCSTSSTRRCRAMRKWASGGCCSAAGDRSRTPMCATTITGPWTSGAARCSSRPASSWTANWSPPISSISTSASASCSAPRITRTGRTRRPSSRTTRSATRWTSAIRGTRPRSRSRRSATSTATTPGSCLRAGTTSAPAITWRSTPAAGRLRGSGPRRSRTSWTSATSRPQAAASRFAFQRPR